MVDFRTVSERGLLASDLYRGSRILRVHTPKSMYERKPIPRTFGGISTRSMTGVRRPLRNTISNAGSTLGFANRYHADPLAPW